MTVSKIFIKGDRDSKDVFTGYIEKDQSLTEGILLLINLLLFGLLWSYMEKQPVTLWILPNIIEIAFPTLERSLHEFLQALVFFAVFIS